MINLLPPQIKENKKYARYNVRLLNYCILVLALSGALAGIMFFGVSLVKADEDLLVTNIESKTATITQLGAVDKKAKSLSNDIKTISNLLGRSVDFSQLIQDIGSVIPNGAKLTGLSLTEDNSGPLQITAITDTQTKGAVLRQNIEESDLFQGADIQSITPREVNGTRDYTVILVVQFNDENAKKKTAEGQPSPNADVPEEEQD